MKIIKRTFLAIKIEPQMPLLELLKDAQNALNKSRIAWVSPENFHFTLHFFGDTTSQEIEKIKEIIHPISQQHSSFEIELKNIGVFDKKMKPVVFWVGTSPNKPLIELQKSVADALRKALFKIENRSYCPHLTLARIKKTQYPNPMDALMTNYKEKHIQSNIINTIILYESILSAEGVVYKPLHAFPLKTNTL